MIKFARIWGIIFRHLKPTFRDPIRLADMFYWPLVDVTLFGFMATWSQENVVGGSNFIITVMTCISCWYLIQRAALEIARNLLIEIWDSHLINLFATPISLAELMIALMIIGIVQALITFFYGLGIIWLLYGQNIFCLLGQLYPFMILLVTCGWVIGFLIVSLLLRFGKNVDTLIWATTWFFAIISGAFYPISLFPLVLQKISYLFPATYLFDGVRDLFRGGAFYWYNLGMGFGLVLVYFILSWLLMHQVFKLSKIRGFARLE